MVSTEVAAAPFGVKDTGLKAQVVKDGNPEQANEVNKLNPLTGVTVMVEVAEPPLVVVALVGESEMLKSGAAFTVTGTALDVEELLLASPA
jgi:hypothetical protein